MLRDREVYVRRRPWWASNDHRHLRVDGAPIALHPTVDPAQAHTNVLRILELFANDSSKRVEPGKLLRQLRRFDEAVAVLKAVKPDGQSEVKANKIQRLARHAMPS